MVLSSFRDLRVPLGANWEAIGSLDYYMNYYMVRGLFRASRVAGHNRAVDP
jgi:hypothetical protein